MYQTGISGILLIAVNLLVSWMGLRDAGFFERYSFKVNEILGVRDYKRLLTSGFLHVSYTHLLFNIVSLCFFCGDLERAIGITNVLFLYFAGLLGGNLLALYIHRNHPDYSAAGASGAINGIIFAAIALFPSMKMGLLFIPVFIPAWAYGILYVLYSIYGIHAQRDQIGHEAHLGGGLAGIAAAAAIAPRLVAYHYFPVLLITVPTLIFLYLVITRPAFLLLDRPFQQLLKPRPFQDIDDRYYTVKKNREKELDELLDQINEKGINSLTRKEREKLEELSKQG